MSVDAIDALAGEDRRRWLAFVAPCLGVLMIAFNAMVVTVALPSIGRDLRFSSASLVWVVDGYLATYGGFLLLGGRLGDLFGQRRLFLIGVLFFTVSALGCGLATSPELLVVARCLQGLGGAVVSAVALSLIVSLFPETSKRAKALGINAFVSTGGGSIGLLIGGVLTTTLSWHWVFFINVPLGAIIFVLGLTLLPDRISRPARGGLDWAGALCVTTSLMLSAYAIVGSHQAGWSPSRTIGLLSGAGALLIVFVMVEARATRPLLPLRLLLTRNVAVANIACGLLAGAVFSWNFIAALYLQLIVHFSPLQVGLAFLPSNLISAAMSIALSPKLIARFGLTRPLVTGMMIVASGMVLLAVAPVDAHIAFQVLPGMLLLGLGIGTAYGPLVMTAVDDVPKNDSGIASGIVTTSFVMGGALGLSLLASLAAKRTQDLLASGVALKPALNSGYHLAFWIAAGFAVTAALISGVLLRNKRNAAAQTRGCTTGRVAG